MTGRTEAVCAAGEHQQDQHRFSCQQEIIPGDEFSS